MGFINCNKKLKKKLKQKKSWSGNIKITSNKTHKEK